MEKMFITKNRLLSLLLSGLLGFLFYIGYGFSKQLLWSWNINHLLTWINPNTDFQNLIFIVILNIVVDLTSSLPAAILCGFLLVKMFNGKAVSYGFCSMGIFLSLSSRLWRGLQAPELDVKISTLISPLLVCLVFLFTILIIKKYRTSLSSETHGEQ